MKLKKLLTSIMSAAMIITSIGSIAVNAEEATETEEKIYTLSELFEMPKDEFLKLNNAQKYYYEIYFSSSIIAYDTYEPLSCVFHGIVFDDDYVPFETEKKLKELIDIDGFHVSSPVLQAAQPEGIYFDYLYCVYNESYKNKYDINEITSEEDILEIAKVSYCVHQVADLAFNGAPGTTLSHIERPYGEANNDGVVNIMDAAFIARKLASGKSEELPETADFNADGQIDIRDAAGIARFMAARAAARAEGWIE